jgi:hypothetical protein
VSRRWLIGALVVGGALIAALVVGTGLGWWNGEPTGGPAPTTRLAVTTSLEPHPAFYGDVLAAEIFVDFNPNQVSASSINPTPSFTPYVQTGPPVVTESGAGRQKTIRYRYSIQCVTDQCLPVSQGKPYVLKLAPFKVTADAGSAKIAATGTWPTTFIATRLTVQDAATTHFRWSKVMPATSYRVSPGTLANGLTVAAALLAIGALALIGFELVRLRDRRRQRALAVLSPLEAALAYTRDAAARPDPADRRKALGLLATTLESEGVPALAGTASDVAWSEEPPTADRAIELADEVEAATATKNGGS